MASVYFDQPFNEILGKNGPLVKKSLDAFMTKYQLISEFLVYLARHKGASDAVLMVDEVLRGETALDECFPGTNNHAAEYLLHAALTYNFEPHGIRSALVLSGLTPYITSFTDSDKRVYPFILSEHLNASEVVDELFLTDIDENEVAHKVTPYCGELESNSSGILSSPSSEVPARQALVLLAEMLSGNPRAIEIAQDTIRCSINYTTTPPRSLALTPLYLRDVNEAVLQGVFAQYPVLFQHGLPSPDLMYALLFGERVPLDQRVAEGIRSSLFINSLGMGDFPLKGVKPPNITLRSSYMSLHAAAMANRALSSYVTVCLRNILAVVNEWTGTIVQCKLGDTPETLSPPWMQLLLTAAVEAGKSHITMAQLLQLESVMRSKTCSHHVKSFLASHITLPKSGTIRVIQLQSTCYGRPKVQGAPAPTRTAALHELNQVVLSEDEPVILFRAAQYDCFDYAIAYLGEKDPLTGERPTMVGLLENKYDHVLRSFATKREQERSAVEAERLTLAGAG